MSNDFAVRLGVILMWLHGLPQSLMVVNLSVGLETQPRKTLKLKIKTSNCQLGDHHKTKFASEERAGSVLYEMGATYSDNDVLAAIVERLVPRGRINDSQALMSQVAPAFRPHEQPTPVRTTVTQPAQSTTTIVSKLPHLNFFFSSLIQMFGNHQHC